MSLEFVFMDYYPEDWLWLGAADVSDSDLIFGSNLG